MKKKGINVPAESGNRGIPPGVGSSFPKGKKRGIVVPSEMNGKGMPKNSYPGGRNVPVIFGGN